MICATIFAIVVAVFSEVLGMNIREACEDIMGEKLASGIIADPKLGLAWCVLSAVADPRCINHPRARTIIRAWLAEQKIKRSPTEGGGK